MSGQAIHFLSCLRIEGIHLVQLRQTPNMRRYKTALILFAILAFGGLLVWAGSQHAFMLSSELPLPIFTLCAIGVLLIQWLAFIPAYYRKTEHFYDLVGGLTYVLMCLVTLWLLPALNERTILLAALIMVWALRLGIFLFIRIARQGSDSRFDSIKLDFGRFLIAWTGQALWIVATAGCALAAMTTLQPVELGWLAYTGLAIWLTGFTIESLADWQKRQFQRQTVKSTPFICTGLWRYSRHPNYFGEIVLWCGVALIAFPVLQGWQHLTLVSPIFVVLLLTKASGIPLLEEKADERWQNRQDYQQYKATTPVLVPFWPASR